MVGYTGHIPIPPWHFGTPVYGTHAERVSRHPISMAAQRGHTTRIERVRAGGVAAGRAIVGYKGYLPGSHDGYGTSVWGKPTHTVDHRPDTCRAPDYWHTPEWRARSGIAHRHSGCALADIASVSA